MKNALVKLIDKGKKNNEIRKDIPSEAIAIYLIISGLDIYFSQLKT